MSDREEPTSDSAAAETGAGSAGDTSQSQVDSTTKRARRTPDEVARAIGLQWNKDKPRYLPGLPGRDLTVAEVRAWIQNREDLDAAVDSGAYSRTDDTPTLPATLPAG